GGGWGGGRFEGGRGQWRRLGRVKSPRWRRFSPPSAGSLPTKSRPRTRRSAGTRAFRPRAKALLRRVRRHHGRRPRRRASLPRPPQRPRRRRRTRRSMRCWPTCGAHRANQKRRFGSRGRPKRQPRPSRHPRSKRGAPRSTSPAFSPPRPPPRSTPPSIRLRERRRRAAVARSRRWSANCCGPCSRVGSTKICQRWSSASCAPRSNACRAAEVEHEQAADAVCGSVRRAAGQAHRKHRTLARLARHRHVAAHHARELAREGKAEPRPAVAARCQGIGLDEVLEQFCLLLRRHADAAIRDRKLDPVAAVRHLAHAQGDLAFFRELTGVLSRLSRICLSRMESAVSAPRLSCASTMRRFWFFSASCPAVPMTSSISLAKFTRSGLSSSLPASIFERSRTSLMRLRRWAPAPFTRRSGSSAFSVPNRAALVTIISVRPMMALSGVRSSWLMLATYCDLFSLANWS